MSEETDVGFPIAIAGSDPSKTPEERIEMLEQRISILETSNILGVIQGIMTQRLAAQGGSGPEAFVIDHARISLMSMRLMLDGMMMQHSLYSQTPSAKGYVTQLEGMMEKIQVSIAALEKKLRSGTVSSKIILATRG